MHTPTILIFAHLDESARELIRTTLPAESYTYVNKHDAKEVAGKGFDRFRQSEICFGNIPAEWLTRAQRLRWLQLESIGFEYYQGLQSLPSTLAITNLAGLFDIPAAETAVGGLLTLFRGIDALVTAQAAGRWVSLEVRPQTQLMSGKRVVILGHGSIGRKLRQFLEAFACRVQSFARTAPDVELRTTTELDQALATADIVACCLPKTPETRGLFSRRRIDLLGPGAVFVNIGRGPVVDEPALIDALQQRRIGGAVLDVAWDEPIPPGHPLWNCPRTLLLQHTGGGYNGELIAKARVFLDNLARLEKGQPLLNRVNLTRGY